MAFSSIIYIVIAIVIALLLLNFVFWRKNSDPLNRKAAAEICSYLTEEGEGEMGLRPIAEIFLRNARYRSQALHIATMIPILLENAGYPKEIAKHASLRVAEAARMIPN